MVDGTGVVAFGLTEPEAGSDALRTTAVPVDGGWRISGQKNSVSHLQAAAVTLVYARVPGSTRWGGVSAFLVETDRRGVSVGSFTDMGQLPIGCARSTWMTYSCPPRTSWGARGAPSPWS